MAYWKYKDSISFLTMKHCTADRKAAAQDVYSFLTVIELENETSWNRRFSDFNENRHKDGNLGLHDYEGQQKFILFNSGKISISG